MRKMVAWGVKLIPEVELVKTQYREQTNNIKVVLIQCNCIFVKAI